MRSVIAGSVSCAGMTLIDVTVSVDLWVARVEETNTVHLVSPQLNSGRQIGPNGEYVDNPAPSADVTRGVDRCFNAVSHTTPQFQGVA